MEEQLPISPEPRDSELDLFHNGLTHLNKRKNPEVLAVLGLPETVERVLSVELDPSVQFFQTELKDTEDEVGEFVNGNKELMHAYKGENDSTLISVGADEAIITEAKKDSVLYTAGMISCVVFALKARTENGEVVIGLSHIFRPSAVERLSQLLAKAKEEGNLVEQVVYLVDDQGGEPGKEDEVVSHEEIERLCKAENADISLRRHPYMQGFDMAVVVTGAGGLAATNAPTSFRYDINSESEYVANEKGKYGAFEDHYTEVSRWEW